MAGGQYSPRALWLGSSQETTKIHGKGCTEGDAGARKYGCTGVACVRGTLRSDFSLASDTIEATQRN